MKQVKMLMRSHRMTRQYDPSFNELLDLISEGWEYPNAHTFVCAKYDLTVEQGEAITAEYDFNDLHPPLDLD